MSSFVVTGQSESRIEVKKSIFIATVREVHSEGDALAFIDEMRRKYWDARHNCFAFTVGEKGEIRRFSDDKEPQGTAGRPILEAITKGSYLNTAIVVTRYFGGILLGTGGLSRAYSQAASLGLSESAHYPVAKGSIVSVECSYSASGKLQYLISSEPFSLLEATYGENVTFRLIIEEEKLEGAVKKITEAASGTASVNILESVSFIRDGSSAKLYSFS